jgi:hypothetical protein
MAVGILRSILGQEQVRRNDTTQIANADLHGHADAALGRATDVVAVPRRNLRDIRIDTTSKKESTTVLYSVMVGSQEHRRANDPNPKLAFASQRLKRILGSRKNVAANDVDSALSRSICSKPKSQTENACDYVGRHGHELRAVVRVAEALDDGRQEQREGVERSEDAEGNETEDPNLPILQGIKDIAPLELVCERASIFFEPTADFFLLIRLQESGSLGVVVHEEESDASY